jgi:AcrR family transcriptional regulator
MRRKDDEKEQRIKDAVIELILREGIDGASISRIARLAEVSPATVYIYFDSKEDMLQDIYREYAEEAYGYVLRRVSPGMDGAALIDSLVRAYYAFMTENRRIFSFVEQCSHCPTLSGCCTERSGVCRLFRLISEQKEAGVIRPYSDETLAAVLFYPVKAIARDGGADDGSREARLTELIDLLQRALLTD